MRILAADATLSSSAFACCLLPRPRASKNARSSLATTWATILEAAGARLTAGRCWRPTTMTPRPAARIVGGRAAAAGPGRGPSLGPAHAHRRHHGRRGQRERHRDRARGTAPGGARLTSRFPPLADRGWEFWIDRGGTFTDVVARRPDDTLTVYKLLSEDPGRYTDPAVAGIRRLLGVPEGARIPAERISAVRLGTTVATNALLERKGEPTVLVITRGFADALRIAYQDRPRIFDRQIVRPEMVYSRVIEATERIGARGEVITALDEGAVACDLRAAYNEGFRSVAVVCMHGYRYPANEARIGEIARRAGFTQVSLSHATSQLMKLVSRGD